MMQQPTFSGGESSQNASVSGPSQVVDLTEGLEGSNSDGTSNPYTLSASGETLTNENSIVPGGSVGTNSSISLCLEAFDWDRNCTPKRGLDSQLAELAPVACA
jgi:hypothetical protein